MWIKVTKLDIERGQCGDSKRCPIARAIKRAFNWNYKTLVSDFWSTIASQGGQEVQFEMPNKANEFIRLFDAGLLPQPISFQIPLPRFVRGRPSSNRSA